MKTWNQAKTIYVTPHPIPGSFGVRAMQTAARIAFNYELPNDTTFIGFTENGRIMIIVYRTPDDVWVSCKRYAPKGYKYRLSTKIKNSHSRSLTMTRAEIENIADDLEATSKAASST